MVSNRSGSRAATSDSELVCEAQAGSLSSFEELVSRYERGIFGFLVRRYGNVADATDLTQSTFVKAFRCLHQQRSGSSFKSWLFTIARNLAISHYRSVRETTYEVPDFVSDGMDPSMVLDRRETTETVWSVARALLPEAQFSALWLRYGEDMSLREIGSAMRRTEGHVKVLLHRGRARLARRFRGMNMNTGGAALDRIEEAHDAVCRT